MARQHISAIISKNGINHVRSQIEAAGSLYIPIGHESDLGLDAIIELLDQGMPTGALVAIQIKSGESYFRSEREVCLIPVGNHRDYWLGHTLPVFGVVYVPSRGAAYWVDIKQKLRSDPLLGVIAFKATRVNALTATRLFTLNTETTVLSLPEAIEFSRSADSDEQAIGLLVLFRTFRNQRAAWDELVRFLRVTPAECIPRVLVYWLAHIPWHPDIGMVGEPIQSDTRGYARQLLANLDPVDIEKLLSLVDDEEQIARGTVGQSVDAIVSIHPERISILEGIMKCSPNISVRESAAILLAMYIGKGAIEPLQELALESELVRTLIWHLSEYGFVDPY